LFFFCVLAGVFAVEKPRWVNPSATMRDSMGRMVFRKCALICFCAVVALATASLGAQQPPASLRSTSPSASQQGVYLVFPFENAGASPRLDWLGEGLEELTIQYLSGAGEQVYSHAGRAGELERYGLPASAKLSRATMLRIAQDLDADFVIFGSFASDGTSLTVDSRVLRVDPTALLLPVHESGKLDSLMELHARVVWQLLSGSDRAYPLALKDFSKLQRPLRLDAFEHFIRGVLANEDEPRLRELREAARLEPTWPDPAFALGETYASRTDCNSALPWFAKVPKTHQRYIEAVFAVGVCRLQLNQPDKAEEVFKLLQDTLRGNSQQDAGATTGVSGADLPEILNNLGIALDRQGKTPDARVNLRRATELDPDEDDYPFNLGLMAFRANEFAAASGYFRDAAEREPDNPDDRALLIQALEKAGNKAEADQEREAVAEALGPNALPVIHIDAKGDALARLERIKTELDITALRLEIETQESAGNSAAANGTAETPGTHIRRGRQKLSAGSLDAAESEFRAALGADPANASAHWELAEVDRRRGKLDDAVKELQASLEARDSAVVRTMLARIYLDQKKPDLARSEVERAVKLAPNYAEAKKLLEHLQNSKPGGGAQ
jgi:tetratricopeptide (TPR) repeat protein/TolB-like protein